MLKFLKVFLISLAVFIFLGWLVMNYLLPSMIVRVVDSDRLVEMLPEEMGQNLLEVRHIIDEHVDEIPQTLDDLNYSFDDMIEFIDDIEEKNMKEIYEEVNMEDSLSADEAFDIIKSHITLDGVDIEHYREQFKNQFDEERFVNALKVANGPDLPFSSNVELVKQVAKRILMQRKAVIESKLDSLRNI